MNLENLAAEAASNIDMGKRLPSEEILSALQRVEEHLDAELEAERQRADEYKKDSDQRDAVILKLGDAVVVRDMEIRQMKDVNARWIDELSKVMPKDFKDWHENADEEKPLVARMVIESLRQREELAWDMLNEERKTRLIST